MALTAKKIKKSRRHKGIKRARVYGERRKKGKHSTREATTFAAGRKETPITTRSI